MRGLIQVFVSSVIEELKKEREFAEETINSLPVTNAWRFESAPASSDPVNLCYLNKVKECDIFVLILAINITQPVLQEYYQAIIYEKPILVFIKKNIERSRKLADFINDLKVKYRQFSTIEEFTQVVKESVLQVISDKFKSAKSSEITQQMFILSMYEDAKFVPLKRDEPRSPLELIKELPTKDKVLPLIAKIPKIPSILEQIEFLQREKYAAMYVDSWAEYETQLIGHYILKQIAPLIGIFSDLYDVGCANCSQYKALMSVKKRIDPQFRYYGQDYNPDWEPRFNIKNGKFFLTPLPLVEERRSKLVSCVHTLHFLEQNPIAIYTSFFSFNKLLENNGYCYLTVPEKEAQPGMIDLLEKSAKDSNFKIIKSIRCRLIHNLNNEPALNITTFIYLILQKNKDIDLSKWKKLLGASFYRGGWIKYSKQYGVNREGEIEEDIRLLELNLREIISEKKPFLRTFRFVLEVVYNKWSGKRQSITTEKCKNEIQDAIKKINEVVTGIMGVDRTSQLQLECANYLYWLIGWYVANNYGRDIKQILYHVYPVIERILKNPEPEDIRVHIEDLTNEQIARLIKHLFELCQYENIDIRRLFEEKFSNNC